MELKYSYPIDRDTYVRFVDNAHDRDIFIYNQLEKRKKRQEYLEENPFMTRGEVSEYGDEYYQPSEWETHNDTRGVFIVSEYGDAVKTICEKWEEAFPTLDCRYINRSFSWSSWKKSMDYVTIYT